MSQVRELWDKMMADDIVNNDIELYIPEFVYT